MTLKRLKDILDFYFIPPFLPSGAVRTRYIDRPNALQELEITIGRRTVIINARGVVTGAGTDLRGGT